MYQFKDAIFLPFNRISNSFPIGIVGMKYNVK